jgi:Tfp pilus assembly protein FimT
MKRGFNLIELLVVIASTAITGEFSTPHEL